MQIVLATAISICIYFLFEDCSPSMHVSIVQLRSLQNGGFKKAHSLWYDPTVHSDSECILFRLQCPLCDALFNKRLIFISIGLRVQHGYKINHFLILSKEWGGITFTAIISLDYVIILSRVYLIGWFFCFNLKATK